MQLVEMTGSNPEDSKFPILVIDEDGEFCVAYFFHGDWYSNETRDGWFNREIRNVVRWFEIRPTDAVKSAAEIE